MRHQLDYAHPPTAERIQVATEPDGAAVIEVLPTTDREPLSRRIAAVVLAIASSMTALYFGGEEQLVMCVIFGLVGAGLMGFLIWSILIDHSRHESGARLRAAWRDGFLQISGPDVPTGHATLPAADVQDIRVDFDGHLAGTMPYMRLTICRASSPVFALLAQQPAADLIWLADTLRRFVALPTRQHRMGTWLAGKSAGFGGDPPRPVAVVPVEPAPVAAIAAGLDKLATEIPALPPALPKPVVPVLAYATPQRTKMSKRGVEFRHHEMILWLPSKGPYGAYISATVSRIQVVWHEGVVEFPCAAVYGVYVGATLELGPLTLYVCALDGIHGVLTGSPPESLRDAARLLNELLGAGGSVYSTRTP